MRVVSGSAKGRPLKAVPGKGTRPTTDKVKEAIFSMIGPYFDGGMALDLFAGTGGLGIEALSRGIEHAVFVDMDPVSVEVVKANLAATRLAERAEVYRNEAERALHVLAKRGVRFQLIFLDPPYRLTYADKLLERIAEEELAEIDAVAVVEHDASHRYPERLAGWVLSKQSVYGETAVSIYRADEGDKGEETNEGNEA